VCVCVCVRDRLLRVCLSLVTSSLLCCCDSFYHSHTQITEILQCVRCKSVSLSLSHTHTHTHIHTQIQYLKSSSVCVCLSSPFVCSGMFCLVFMVDDETSSVLSFMVRLSWSVCVCVCVCVRACRTSPSSIAQLIPAYPSF